MHKSNEPIKLATNDKILCDPSYTLEHKADGKLPICTIPANVISTNKTNAYVEIIDEKDGLKRRFTNTDLYGSTCYVLLEACEKPANERLKQRYI